MENKFLDSQGVSNLWKLITAYVDDKLWMGTKLQYDIASALGEIAVGTMVIITDESDVIVPPVEENTSSIAILGTALLGSMILGQS